MHATTQQYYSFRQVSGADDELALTCKGMPELFREVGGMIVNFDGTWINAGVDLIPVPATTDAANPSTMVARIDLCQSSSYFGGPVWTERGHTPCVQA